MTKILVADDHAVVRRGIKAILEERQGWSVVGEAATGDVAVDKAAELRPDVAIVDYALPVMNGAQVTRRIKTASPDTQILIFTLYDNEALVRDCLMAGARGFLLKSDAERLLITAVEALARKRPFFTDQISEALLTRYLSSSVGDGGLLTPREKEVVQLIAEGQSSKLVSRTLGISLKTVESHRAAAMHKLGLTTTAALVRYAVRNHLVQP